MYQYPLFLKRHASRCLGRINCFAKETNMFLHHFRELLLISIFPCFSYAITADFSISSQGYILTGSSVKIAAGSSVSLDASLSTPSAGQSISMYEWQWANPYYYTGQPASEFSFTADATGVQQEYLYPAIGSYRLTLRVSDDIGAMALSQKVVTVEARQAPTSNPGGPYSISVGEDLHLNGSLSTDPDIAYGDMLTQYQWSLGFYPHTSIQGAAVTIPWEILEDILEPNNYPGLLGIYTVALKVTDTTLRTHTAYTSLEVVPEPASLVLLALSGLAVLRRGQL
jgi:hypothetical protein